MKINNKLITILLILSIIFLSFKVLPLISTYFINIKKILNPILISFIISYFLYPIVKFFNKKFSKTISIFITILIIIIVLFIIFYFSIPILLKEINSLIEELSYLLPIILKNIDNNIINSLINSISSNISITSFSFINKSISFIINIIMITVMTISLLINMDKIRTFIDKKLNNKKINILITKIDNDLSSYIKSIFIIMLIEIIEYTTIYFLIGHPYYYLLGVLVGITTIIPYVGALFTNLLALITTLNISKRLFILTSLVALLIPIIDNYLVDPKIMSKTTKIPFIMVIISIIISSSLFGFMGFILATPLYIIISNIIKYISNKVE